VIQWCQFSFACATRAPALDFARHKGCVLQLRLVSGKYITPFYPSGECLYLISPNMQFMVRGKYKKRGIQFIELFQIKSDAYKF